MIEHVLFDGDGVSRLRDRLARGDEAVARREPTSSSSWRGERSSRSGGGRETTSRKSPNSWRRTASIRRPRTFMRPHGWRLTLSTRPRSWLGNLAERATGCIWPRTKIPVERGSCAPNSHTTNCSTSVVTPATLASRNPIRDFSCRSPGSSVLGRAFWFQSTTSQRTSPAHDRSATQESAGTSTRAIRSCEARFGRLVCPRSDPLARGRQARQATTSLGRCKKSRLLRSMMGSVRVWPDSGASLAAPWEPVGAAKPRWPRSPAPARFRHPRATPCDTD
ncbi:MAG: hypothetical protein JWN22_1265 [Nocardioides sp.]|jgi:hypothetical protein|nr:hypothetical protein [Nocardioides sp.]